MHTINVSSWKEAYKKVREIAGPLPIHWGAGNPVYEPYVMARPMDALSGEGYGYIVVVYPQGEGVQKPSEFYRICVHQSLSRAGHSGGVSRAQSTKN